MAAVLLVLALPFLWWTLWQIAAAQYRGQIDRWIEEGRANGYVISYDNRQQFGFPLRITLRYTGLHWRNADGITFEAGDIDIAALPWRTRDFTAKFKQRATLSAPFGSGEDALLLSAERGEAHVSVTADGKWLVSSIDVNAAKVGHAPDNLVEAGALTATATRPIEDPHDHHEAGLIVSAAASNIFLPPALNLPFGNRMAKINIDLRIMGAVPDFRRHASVDAWNKNSGIVEFDRLRVEWGTLVMSLKGTLGFDDDLQPEGAFSGAVANHDKVLMALMSGGYIPARQEDMLHSAMQLFARPMKQDGIDGIEMPITVQLGGLFLGPVKIYSFSEIVWPADNGTP
ncbi:MAG: DUF2125 domain-containing protein [Alphaproteobacteria bacterium]|nr:DUF2125 domain-containing protein [Alphaproteobacteria bacterium]